MRIFRTVSSSLFLLLLLHQLFSGDKPEKSHVLGEEMAANTHFNVLEMRSLIPAPTCNPPPTERVGSVPLVHRQGPCSPLQQERLQPPDSTLAFLRDQSRVDSIKDSLASLSSSSGVYRSTAVVSGHIGFGYDLRVPVVAPSAGAGLYVVMVGLGTPRRDLPLIFDTGSSLTWTQCLPCPTEDCCPRQDRCFEPSKSSTYSDPPCSSPRCNYSIIYADLSFSNGYFARDTLAFSPDYEFPNFVFGCGQNNSDGFGTSAGILGLAQGGVSLFSQIHRAPFLQIFCYCIPPTYSSQGYLHFGMGARENCPSQAGQYTNILPDPTGSSFYYVKLLGLTIGNRSLLVSSSSPPRTIIDSGTTITHLPPSVYSALRDEFRNQMSKYPVAPALPPLLDTCYNLEGHGGVALPKMVLNFHLTNVTVDPSGVLWREKDSQVCLAFTANKEENDLIIIGNTQQKKLNILYDVEGKRVEFGTGSCGN